MMRHKRTLYRLAEPSVDRSDRIHGHIISALARSTSHEAVTSRVIAALQPDRCGRARPEPASSAAAPNRSSCPPEAIAQIENQAAALPPQLTGGARSSPPRPTGSSTSARRTRCACAAGCACRSARPRPHGVRRRLAGRCPALASGAPAAHRARRPLASTRAATGAGCTSPTAERAPSTRPSPATREESRLSSLAPFGGVHGSRAL